MSSVTFTAEAESTGLLLPLRLPLRRVLAIDAFRGLTILAMIFVNTLEDVEGMPSWLYHTPENSDGLTFPDLVFPAFLFIVGMSIPFATAQRLAAGDTVLATPAPCADAHARAPGAGRLHGQCRGRL